MDIKIRAQVTIFVILGVILVVGILAGIYFMGDKTVKFPVESNPEQYVKKCVVEAVEDSVSNILLNGGRINPVQTIMYLGDEYNYLCYQADYYKPCINTHPALELIIEDEIKKDTEDEVQECFDAMKENLENLKFDVYGGATTYSVDLLPGEVKITLRKNIQIQKDAEQSFDNFDTKINSPIYELIKVVREIVNSEAETCRVEYNGLMMAYPKYKIELMNYDFSKIYWVTDRPSGKMFRFAVRSCAFRPGI